MSERRSSSRHRSFLQGRLFFNNRRSSVDCLVRDISDTGARLESVETVHLPESLELYIPSRDEIRHARLTRRDGKAIGVSFGEASAPTLVPDMPSSDLLSRVVKLETEIITLRRQLNELRAELRKAHGDV